MKRVDVRFYAESNDFRCGEGSARLPAISK